MGLLDKPCHLSSTPQRISVAPRVQLAKICRSRNVQGLGTNDCGGKQSGLRSRCPSRSKHLLASCRPPAARPPSSDPGGGGRGMAKSLAPRTFATGSPPFTAPERPVSAVRRPSGEPRPFGTLIARSLFAGRFAEYPTLLQPHTRTGGIPWAHTAKTPGVHAVTVCRSRPANHVS